MFPLDYDEAFKTLTYQDADGNRYSFRPVRISTSIRLHWGNGFRQLLGKAFVDTGAPLTVFPYAVWKPYEEAIRWVDPADPLSAAALHVRTVAAKESVGARLGVVKLSLQTSGRNGSGLIETEPADVLAKFLSSDANQWPHPVLGICGNALSRFSELKIQFQETSASLLE